MSDTKAKALALIKKKVPGWKTAIYDFHAGKTWEKRADERAAIAARYERRDIEGDAEAAAAERELERDYREMAEERYSMALQGMSPPKRLKCAGCGERTSHDYIFIGWACSVCGETRELKRGAA